MAEADYVFPPDAWANIVLMAEDGYDPEDNAATLVAAMRRHPSGCDCDNVGCRRSKARDN